MFTYTFPNRFQLVSKFGTSSEWFKHGRLTVEFQSSGIWICKDLNTSGMWKLNQNMFNVQGPGGDLCFKHLLGTESFEGVHDLLIPEKDWLSESSTCCFRLYRGTRTENNSPPCFYATPSGNAYQSSWGSSQESRMEDGNITMMMSFILNSTTHVMKKGHTAISSNVLEGQTVSGFSVMTKQDMKFWFPPLTNQ